MISLGVDRGGTVRGGLLIDGDGLPSTARKALFCTDWCVAWDAKRQASELHPVRPRR